MDSRYNIKSVVLINSIIGIFFINCLLATNIMIYIPDQYELPGIDSVLTQSGFNVTVTNRTTTPVLGDITLAEYDQFWLWSHGTVGESLFSDSELNSIQNFWQSGGDLVLMADDMNYLYQDFPNQICDFLNLGASFFGTVNHGQSLIPVQLPDFETTHPIWSNVDSIFGANHEGNIEIIDSSKVIVIGKHNNGNMVAVGNYSGSTGKVVFLSSFVRFGDDYIVLGDNARHAINIASFLVESTNTTIAHWTFNEMSGDTLHDISGNRNNLVISGATWVEGGALSFDGINDYAAAINTDTLNIQSDQVTVEVIMKTSASSYGGHKKIIGKGDTSGPQGGWGLIFSTNNSNPNALSFHVGGTVNTDLYGSISVNDGRWHHVAGIFTGDSIKLYVDHILDASQSANPPSFISNGMFGIGGGDNNNTGSIWYYFFPGEIKEVKISNIALPPTAFLEDPSLIAYYPFNGNANDESGNENDGIVLGGAVITSDLTIGNNNSEGVSLPYTIINGLNDFSFSANIRIHLLHIGNNGVNCLTSGARSDQDNAFDLQYNGNNQNWQIGFNSNHFLFDPDSTINDYNWHHLIVLRNGSTARLYLDGVEIGNGISVSDIAIDIDSTGFIIGQEQDALGGGFDSNQSWTGDIDDIRIYSRALSPTEVSLLYQEDRRIIVSTDLFVEDTYMLQSDTATISLFADFHSGSAHYSAELTLSGYQNGLTFVGLDTTGSLVGAANWSYAVNEIGDSLVISWLAGAQPISGSGVFCNLRFVATGASCQTYPVNLLSATFDTGADSVVITNGSVTIHPLPHYGDADENGEIQAYDAAMVLKHVVGIDTLFCQGLVNADVSANDTVTAMDASLILQYGTGLIDTLPYSEPALASGSLHLGTPYIVDEFAYIPLVMTNGEMVYSLEGELVYDETLLRYEGLVWSNPITDSVMERTTEGKTSLAGAGANGWNYSGTIATARFSFLHAGSGTVSLQHHRLNENHTFPNESVDVSSLGTGNEAAVPTTYALHQNYPNPFNPSTTLQIDLPQNSPVQVIILDMLGRRVTTLTDRNLPAGVHRLVWNGKDYAGNSVPTGIYFARMETPEYNRTIKMIMMK